MTRYAAASAVALLLAASPSAAKDLCFTDSLTAKVVLKKFKAPKKPGQVSSLQGFYIAEGRVYPIAGSAVTRGDGRVVLGAMVHRVFASPSTVDYSVSMVFNPASGSATGYYDTNGDGDIDTSQGWTPSDCKQIVVP